MFIKNVSQVFTFFLLPFAHNSYYLITLNSFEKLTNFLFANFVTRRLLVIENNFGVIINVSLGAGKVGFQDISAYFSTKIWDII
jgi:hypothetical protein